MDQTELARLLPEYLLCGHLIDRAGMPYAIEAFGREGMAEVAIEEWMAASPIYTRRMRAALGLTGDGVTDMFRCLQIDVGAPPQFMDFRFTVHDEQHGQFELAHCGALMDVEPMGEEFVSSMCHDIEDPTFDATAIATNPRARIRPIHRPPRMPADRHPHCGWTVTIDPDVEELPFPAEAVALQGSEAAGIALPTAAATASELLADIDFTAMPAELLTVLAAEVALQWHLIGLGFLQAVRARTNPENARQLGLRQVTGVAGLTSERLRAAFELPDVESVLAIHPVLLPTAYTGVSLDRDTLRIPRDSPAVRDGGWLSLVDSDHLAPLNAMVRGIGETLVVEVVQDDEDALVVRVVDTGTTQPEADPVQLAKLSTGAGFAFQPRRSLPLMVL
ncbi:MAG: hypothetical protein JWR35_2981 [Marmoricola sp.]|nr:hypothetical protein [Marmoricola sp.]